MRKQLVEAITRTGGAIYNGAVRGGLPLAGFRQQNRPKRGEHRQKESQSGGSPKTGDHDVGAMAQPRGGV